MSLRTINLIYAFHVRSDNHSPRELLLLNFVTQCPSDIRHLSGTANVVADALSRVAAIYI